MGEFILSFNEFRIFLLFTMKPFLLYLALGILPVLGETEGVLVAPITLYTIFPWEPSRIVQEALEDQLARIMAPIGFRFEWRTLKDVNRREIPVELAVVTFRGRCDVAGLMPRSVNSGALGWTHTGDGTILPFSEVDCDRIRNFVQGTLLAVPREDRDEVFGRALGRVLAHELYHVFANTGKHGSDGVAKEGFTVLELLADDFQFRERECRALRASKAYAALEIAALHR